MLKSSHVLLYYFSATGNTKLVVDRMTEVLRGYGTAVDLVEIRSGTRPEPAADDVVGLAFPGAYFSTFPFIWEFFQALPVSHNAGVFMVDTMAGISGGITGPLYRLLKEKGYRPIGAREILMPLNFMFINPRLMLHSFLKRRGLRKAEEYAGALVAGTAKWKVVPFWSSWLYPAYLLIKILLFSGLSQKLFKIRTDSLKCIACGKCAKNCPVGAITMTMGRDGLQYPRIANTCEFCLRCIAVCPNDAGSFVLNGSRIYRAG